MQDALTLQFKYRSAVNLASQVNSQRVLLLMRMPSHRPVAGTGASRPVSRRVSEAAGSEIPDEDDWGASTSGGGAAGSPGGWVKETVRTGFSPPAAASSRPATQQTTAAAASKMWVGRVVCRWRPPGDGSAGVLAGKKGAVRSCSELLALFGTEGGTGIPGPARFPLLPPDPASTHTARHRA